jgi:hypothetical protein
MGETNVNDLSIDKLTIGGVAITATPAEINQLAGQGAVAADVAKLHAIAATAAEIDAVARAASQGAEGLRRMMVAVARYDFSVDGGAISAIGSGVTIPDNAIICGGFVDVDQTCTSAGADAGTMAISVQGANDIVSAVAISDGTHPWDAGLHAIIPKANTPESTGVKLTAAREITFTIATQAFTAGKFTVFLEYLQGS